MNKKIQITILLLLLTTALVADRARKVEAKKMRPDKAYISAILSLESRSATCKIEFMNIYSGKTFGVNFSKDKNPKYFEIPEGEYIVATIVGGVRAGYVAHLSVPSVMLPTLKITNGTIFFLGEFLFKMDYPKIRLDFQLEKDEKIREDLKKSNIKDFLFSDWEQNYPVVEGSDIFDIPKSYRVW